MVLYSYHNNLIILGEEIDEFNLLGEKKGWIAVIKYIVGSVSISSCSNISTRHNANHKKIKWKRKPTVPALE